MKKNWISKAVIFVAGVAAGGATVYFATKKTLDKRYRKAADEEIFEANQLCKEKIKGYKEEIKQLQEKISRQKVTINTLADQVREGGNGEKLKDILKDDDDAEADPRPEETVREIKRETESDGSSRSERLEYIRRARSSYGRAFEEPDDGVEFPEAEDEEDPEYDEYIASRKPRQIDEETFSTTALGPFMYSKNTLYYYIYDGKMIDDDGEWIENYEALTGHIDVGNYSAGDEVYIRNTELCADYQIVFVAGYGEQHISMSDIWDDED